jgi:hypothetical protein
MGLLKAENDRVTLLNEGLQVGQLYPETIQVSLEKIHNGWSGIRIAGIRRRSLWCLIVVTSVSLCV